MEEVDRVVDEGTTFRGEYAGVMLQSHVARFVIHCEGNSEDLGSLGFVEVDATGAGEEETPD